ncbi:SOS response-associated peptidase [Gorillibacterium sp. CAU 1737]|uniref:SOS response-associated peptidase n=1 Tax=Gorillibacterium sp. CAU 1737 TaxID=3140362 RepID=UPI0032612242
MCGRYTITVTLEELESMFRLGPLDNPNYRPRYNVAPGQMIPAILAHEGKNRLGELRWGLLPSWSQGEPSGRPLINARSETVHDKPSFRGLFERKRCIIPADGFYEWQKNGTARKPYRIVLKDRSLFSMAALYDTWIGPDGRKVSTAVILTTSANELMEPIHTRMPVILRQEDEALWLDRTKQDFEALKALLKPFHAGAMRAYPVSPAVGSVQNDTPELLRELSS